MSESNWLNRRLARGQKPRKEVVMSMLKVAKDNKGLIPLLRTSTAASSLSIPLLASMIQDDLVTTHASLRDAVRVALDCEMVGVGRRGSRSALARCSIVGYDGEIIYDSYIKPSEPITDFRTIFSGIQPCHMQYAKPFEVASREIKSILADKIIIGHDLRHDFDAIGMNHPSSMIRDTSELAILQLDRTPSLRLLAKVCLNINIQEGNHSSLIDARACMDIYKLLENPWEKKSTHVKYDDCFGKMCLPDAESCSTV